MSYSQEDTKMMVEYYLNAADKEAAVDELMEIFQKSKKSVVGKLSIEKVYEKKVYKTKQGELPVSKKELVCRIASILSVEPDLLDGLEKSPKQTLASLESILSDVAEQS